MSASPSTNEPLPIHVRSMTEADVPLVMNSWLKSFRDCAATWGVGNDEYYATQKKVITKLLEVSSVAIACDPSDHEQVFGWVCWTPRNKDVVIHYVYVKHLFQRMGVARELMEVANPHDLPIYATHVGPASNDLKATVPHRYKPFILTTILVGG